MQKVLEHIKGVYATSYSAKLHSSAANLSKRYPETLECGTVENSIGEKNRVNAMAKYCINSCVLTRAGAVITNSEVRFPPPPKDVMYSRKVPAMTVEMVKLQRRTIPLPSLTWVMFCILMPIAVLVEVVSSEPTMTMC